MHAAGSSDDMGYYQSDGRCVGVIAVLGFSHFLVCGSDTCCAASLDPDGLLVDRL